MSDMGIYKITNTVNGKVYIGQSTQLSRRLNKHLKDLKKNRHHNQHLQNSYNKYDDVFEIEIIEYCNDESELDDLERYYIAYYDSMNPQKGYNKEDGGSLNKHLSAETRKKISENHHDVSGVNHPMYGKTHSAEARKKMSKNHHDVSGVNNPMYGKTHSAETRKKISEASKGKTFSAETRKKISEARNTTGFYRVSKHNNNCKQGFSWRYTYQNKEISYVNILKLKDKVEAQGLPWEIIDEEKAKESLELNNKYHKGEYK